MFFIIMGLNSLALSSSIAKKQKKRGVQSNVASNYLPENSHNKAVQMQQKIKVVKGKW